jgi:alpha-tubulin suppressor-like RCC1 family protein
VLVSGVRRLLIVGFPPPVPPPTPAAHAVGWGLNDHGQLGGGYRNELSTVPVAVPGLGSLLQVAATFDSFALESDGIVRSWGGNFFGQLGDGVRSKLPSLAPTAVSGLTGVKQIAVGGSHAMALLSNGTVATWGGNLFGQLGNGTTAEGHETSEHISSPVPIVLPGVSGVVSIAAGGADDAALLGNGTVLAWGENKYGVLGDGTTSEKDVPTLVRGLTGVKAIALGGSPSDGAHLLALLGNGTVMALGDNRFGQLGDGSTAIDSVTPVAVKGLSGVKAIAAGYSHSMALLENGTVVTWGSDKFGQLGVGPVHETCTNTIGTATVSCSRVPVTVALHNASAITAGLNFSLALSGGAVLSWGANENGQLGDGNKNNSSTPVSVSGLSGVAQISAGEYHSLALLSEAPPQPAVELIPGSGTLTVRWRAAETGEPWTVRFREAVRPVVPWPTRLHLAPSTRSYTITGLLTKPYEVLVSNPSFGNKIVLGTPLP